MTTVRGQGCSGCETLETNNFKFGETIPTRTIVIIIWTKEASQFEREFGDLYRVRGKRADATGVGQSYKSHLQIMQHNMSQLFLNKTTGKVT